MKIFRSIEDYNLNQRTILTIGTFDGVHEGHKKILNKLMSTSKKKSLSSVVLTFFPHPRIILNKYNEVKMIDTLDEKIKAFEKLGIENLIIHPFDKNFSLLSADQFIKDYLIEKLKINHIIIGYDHRFGKGREASVDDLKKYGESFDFIVEEIKAHEVESIAVSSTKIRDSINSGNLDKSAKFLGRFFKITGKVIKGDGLGKQINYPTANLYVEENSESDILNAFKDFLKYKNKSFNKEEKLIIKKYNILRKENEEKGLIIKGINNFIAPSFLLKYPKLLQ